MRLHIPDGLLDPKTWGTAWGLSAGTIGYALYKVREKFDEKMVPLLGITAAFIFAAQMLNFPVAAGVSGHFMGGVLAAVLVGPWAGLLVMVVVLTVQCFVFADGGLTALGANIFNMGVVGCLCAYYVMYGLKLLLRRRMDEKSSLLASVAVASWLSIVMASACCAVELWFSGLEFKIIFPALVSVHVLIGIGEALITTVVVGLLLQVRPDVVYAYRGPVVRTREVAGEAA